jgi:hypothetical protein
MYCRLLGPGMDEQFHRVGILSASTAGHDEAEQRSFLSRLLVIEVFTAPPAEVR